VILSGNLSPPHRTDREDREMNVHNSSSNFEAQTPIVQFWNETLAPKFIRYQHIMEGGLARHSREVMAHLDIPSDGKVLDVGCGFGDTPIAIANRVYPKGKVLGVDCCDAFLSIARNRPERFFAPNVQFENRDAERDLGEAEFDFVFSRFGTMFFTNPVAGCVRSAVP